ncbi:hypothetical protein BVRB_9g224830 [Beta vulgaris subsp. vulgaris]|uniref:Uncharacterized protein n=1 Tax=Beta vulgaris subsp. vulgaris TaxID=3555 RepID=A0A0J8E063_BETVV|nr:hypothetical protein BVRB_9g224830 [Beta vulgaris subsp. vulgaris]
MTSQQSRRLLVLQSYHQESKIEVRWSTLDIDHHKERFNSSQARFVHPHPPCPLASSG